MDTTDPDYGVRSLNGSMLDTRPLQTGIKEGSISAGRDSEGGTVAGRVADVAIKDDPLERSPISGNPTEGTGIARQSDSVGREAGETEEDLTLWNSQSLTPGPNFRPDPFAFGTTTGTGGSGVSPPVEPGQAMVGRIPGSLGDAADLHAYTHVIHAEDNHRGPSRDVGDDRDTGMQMIMPDGNDFSPSSSHAQVGMDSAGNGRTPRAGRRSLAVFGPSGEVLRDDFVGGGDVLPPIGHRGGDPLIGDESAGMASEPHIHVSALRSTPFTQFGEGRNPLEISPSTPPFAPHPPSSTASPSTSTSTSTSSIAGSFSFSNMSGSDWISRTSSPSAFALSDGEDGDEDGEGEGSARGSGVGRGGVEPETAGRSEVASPRSIRRRLHTGWGEQPVTPTLETDRGRSGTIIPRTSVSSSGPLRTSAGPSGTFPSGVGLASANGSVQLPPRRVGAVPPTAQPASGSATPPPLARPRQYAYSRSHWAVEEAKRRSEEQGEDLVLDIPDLPEGELRSDGLHAKRVRRPYSILLCGTNRTTNAFLKALMADGRVEIYRMSKLKSRDETGSRRSKKEAGYRLAVFDSRGIVNLSTGGGRIRLAVITVVGKGQVGNVQRAITAVEATYDRLNRLLRDDLVPLEDFRKSADRRRDVDLARLVDAWITSSGSPPDEDGRRTNQKHWFDLCIATGDGRVLQKEDSFDLDRLTRITPCICYPDTLAQRLTESLSITFSPIRSAEDDGLGNAVENLILLFSDPTPASGREARRIAGVEAFLQWRSAKAARPQPSPSESSGGMTSQLLPLPTVAAAAGKGEARADWEAGLSRRHAEMHQRKASRGQARLARGAIRPLPIGASRHKEPPLFSGSCFGKSAPPLSSRSPVQGTVSTDRTPGIFGLFQHFFARTQWTAGGTDVPSGDPQDKSGPASRKREARLTAVGVGIGIITAGFLYWRWASAS